MKQSLTKREIVIAIVCSVVVIATLITAIVVHKRQQSAEAQRQATELKISEQTKVEAEQKRNVEESRKATVTARLVSICLEAQARYDGLNATQKASSTRPDCTQ